MSLYLLLLLANPTATEPEAWVGPSATEEAEELVAPVRYDEAPKAEPAPAFSQRVLALEIALSTLVAERPTLWRFARLEAEAASLLTQASTDADRRAVRSIANRIDGFARIAARHRRARDNADGWSRPAVASSPSPRVAPPVRLTKAAPQRPSPHDAEGVLRPVVSKRPGAPKYAIVNDRGDVTTLVTPKPGVEKGFEKLVGKRVGLNGQRGFLTDLQRQHLVAERVTPLGTTPRQTLRR